MTNFFWKNGFLGIVAGALSAAVALACWSGLGPLAGGVMGLLAGAGVGIAAFGMLGQRQAGRMAAWIDELLAPRGAAERFADTGWPQLDRRLEVLGTALEQLRRTHAEFDEVERLARSLWRGLGEPAAEGAGASEPRGAVLSLLAEVRITADRLTDDAHALDQTTEQIASGAWDQSETVGHTTSTVEALSEKIDQISHNAEAAAEAGQRSRAEARRGLEQVHGLIEGIDRLRAHVESNGRKVRRLGDRSVEIGAIVDLIDGISGRTDMLALNATIESVRAGEHGRGFAVVAEEIRKLAERSAAATREIGALVEAIQADTHESIAALGQEQAEVEQEAQRVREAGAALERISEVAEHSARLVEGISRSANDQVTSTHELVRAMQRISEVTQQTQSGSGRLREHVRLLAQRCDRLHRLSPLDSPAARVNGAAVAPRPGRAAGNGLPRRPSPVEQPT
jgi:methyl-accepting chemotaxis protein